MVPSNRLTYVYIHITDLDASFSQEQGLLNKPIINMFNLSTHYVGHMKLIGQF